MNNILLSLVVVTNNRKEDLENLLDSILNQKDVERSLFEIVIVNNGEDIGDLIKKYEKKLNIKYIKNNGNLGASKGRNIGVKNSKGKYILFLDDDNYLQDEYILKNIIEKDIELLEKDNKIGAIRYATEYPIYKNGKRIGYEYTVCELDTKTKKSFDIPNNIKLLKENSIYFYLNHFATCGVLVRKEAFEKINGFDENMFVYAEDIDLSIRLWINNYKVLLNPWIIIRHNETPKKRNNLWREYQMTKNQILMLYKNFPMFLFLFYTINWLTIQSILSYKNLKQKEPDITFLQMYREFLKGTKEAFKLIFIQRKVKRKPMSFKMWKYIRFGIPKENIKILKEKGLL
ncbi:glycosyl transferase family 2 [Methanocaldococcus vulcanius M7]|uniref:Glycosyl transferase family 2 n=1 Tax=Methanocaldococcus vulcanius (strain ATCC 700851 / DSM 12094 / M7) TaxID=579137 RepID=C9RED6_METVM|nr:glycosyltransferase [Methanocaldococcus vulcanius]ACX71938.1 glycosyl transferase family 2 [Methanocaldococcus vulcanius M7]